MIKSKLAYFFDSIILSFISLFISLIWIRRLTKNAFLSYFLSIIVFLAVFILYFIKQLKKHNLKLFSNIQENKLTNLINYLKFCDYKTYNSYFEILLNSFTIDKFLFKMQDNFIYINLKYEPTDKDFQDTIQLYLNNKTQNSKLFFLDYKFSKSFLDVINKSPYKDNIIPLSSLTKLMLSKPEISSEFSSELISFKEKLKRNGKQYLSNITRNRFKDFFFTGLSLILISLVIPYSFYYLIIGSILIFISFCCLSKESTTSKCKSEDIILSQIKKPSKK